MRSGIVMACLLLGAVGLSGCGVSYDLTVRNETEGALTVELLEGFADYPSPRLSTDLAAGHAFAFTMRDGPRSESKSIRISRRGDDESALVFPVRVGERWLPKTTEIRVEDADGALVARTGDS